MNAEISENSIETEIEILQGQEFHTSNWGKFYVKGLEAFRVREDVVGEHHDNHHSYTGYFARPPEGTLFTIFEQNGNRRGTQTFRFAICAVKADAAFEWQADYGSAFVKGNFFIVCQTNSQTKSPRMMNWWGDCPPEKRTLAFALHCAQWIEKRGVKDLPPLEPSVSPPLALAPEVQPKLTPVPAKIEESVETVSQFPKIHPRQPLENDREYVEKNLEAAVWLLDRVDFILSGFHCLRSESSDAETLDAMEEILGD